VENKFILTAFGKDRPGIVAEIAEVIFENKCNLEDSNMGRLADEFTLILLLTGKGKTLQDKLSRDCKRLEREKNIFVFIRPLDYQLPDTKNGNAYCTIEIEGIDQAGIVYKVSKFLADNGINIETLKSQKKFSPNSGTALYSMEINTKVPDTISMETLDENLESLANELNVDINVK
jgi:glycine cleavage system transcriptional repressor